MQRWLLTVVIVSALAAAIVGAANARIPKSHRLKAGQSVVFKRGTIRIGALEPRRCRMAIVWPR